MKHAVQILIPVLLLVFIIFNTRTTPKPQLNGGSTIVDVDDTPIPPIVEEKPDSQSPLLTLHNTVRKTPLLPDSDLNKFAQDWAKHMEKTKNMKHSKMDFPGSWSDYGENIAHGQDTEQEVFGDWMNSKGHRNNIKNESFTHIGIGRSGNYWCVCFGKKTTYWWSFWR